MFTLILRGLKALFKKVERLWDEMAGSGVDGDGSWFGILLEIIDWISNIIEIIIAMFTEMAWWQALLALLLILALLVFLSAHAMRYLQILAKRLEWKERRLKRLKERQERRRRERAERKKATET